MSGKGTVMNRWCNLLWKERGASAVPGNQGQDLEPPSAGRRRINGSQQPGDGSVPAVPRGRITGVVFAAIDMIEENS